MAKRRRDRVPNLPPDAYNAPAASVSAAPTAVKAGAAAAVAAPRKPLLPIEIDWKKEYGEVLGDLRRTFIIFFGLIVLMVALSFVIR